MVRVLPIFTKGQTPFIVARPFFFAIRGIFAIRENKKYIMGTMTEHKYPNINIT